MARQKRLERSTFSLGGRRSIQLSYWRVTCLLIIFLIFAFENIKKTSLSDVFNIFLIIVLQVFLKTIQEVQIRMLQLKVRQQQGARNLNHIQYIDRMVLV